MRPLIGLVLIGCATGGAPATPTDREIVTDQHGRVYRTLQDAGLLLTLAAPADDVRRALLAAYDVVGIEIVVDDRATGQLGNQRVTFMRQFGGEPGSRILNCGTDQFAGPIANNYRVEMSVVSVVRGAPDAQTTVETRLEGWAQNPAASNNPLHCSSTGRLEQRIHELVKSAVED